jgi:hypothetical protein
MKKGGGRNRTSKYALMKRTALPTSLRHQFKIAPVGFELTLFGF